MDNQDFTLESLARASAGSTYQKKPRKFRKLLIVAGALLILGVASFAAYDFADKNGYINVTTTPTPTLIPEPTQEVIPTAEPTQNPNETLSPSRKVTPSPTGKTTSSSGLDRFKLSITVLNGSGTSGAAGKMKETLENLGYTVVSTGNADSYDYEKTEIHVSSANKMYLDQLKKDLSDDYTIGKTSTTYSGTGAQVIVGKE